MKGNFKKFEEKIETKIDKKLLLFKIFDDPRPNYVSKVTLTDKIINVLFLWAFPRLVRPNYVTVFRIASIPFIVYFLCTLQYKEAFVLFLISAISDAIDGSLARTRNQITDWGIVFDPFADKLLIGIVGGILIFKFLSPLLAAIIIL
ncbi:MAG: CDP-alcohol phosphatidyltransferase family protein, partial [Candidatus Paceibacterota bacterium]